MSSIPTEIAETIQTAHIAQHPDPLHDNAPPTVGEKRVPVSLSSSKPVYDDDLDDDAEDDIPYSVLRPAPRSHQLPPLPDLRFEQSYLHSIANADTWWKVALITTRDQVGPPYALAQMIQRTNSAQVLMPLFQGVLLNLFWCGWTHWNKNARVHGNTAGARLRRWWYGVNNWKLPPQSRAH
jgi:hypothetical protein